GGPPARAEWGVGGGGGGRAQPKDPAADRAPFPRPRRRAGNPPVLLAPGGRAAAVADEEQRGARAHDAFPSGGSTERRTSALRAAAATALASFSPTLEIVGSPLARRRAFDSAAPTNPTGRPTTRAGANAPHSARPTTSSRAVGAQPTTTMAPAGWHAAAARMPSALRVVPASPPVSGRWHSAWIPWMPCRTISTSQTTGAPARTAHTPASTAASSARIDVAYSGSALAWITRSTTARDPGPRCERSTRAPRIRWLSASI